MGACSPAVHTARAKGPEAWQAQAVCAWLPLNNIGCPVKATGMCCAAHVANMLGLQLSVSVQICWFPDYFGSLGCVSLSLYPAAAGSCYRALVMGGANS